MKVICWFSGGVTSAVACHLAIQNFGKENCEVVFIDTKNEHEDTERFLLDCQEWFGIKIKRISAIPTKYQSIEDVWIRHKSLNVAHGAICSSELKRVVREKWQKENNFEYQVFGFDFDTKEFRRAMGLRFNHPKAKAIFPLLMFGFTKEDCFKYLEDNGVKRPLMYDLGFNNNNCFKTMCIQGGIGYWKKVQKEFPEKFEKMANLEHYLSELKGSPVTILKDQSKESKGLVFLRKNSNFPHLKSLDEMKGKFESETLNDCNGFCGVNDLSVNKNLEEQLNFDLNS